MQGDLITGVHEETTKRNIHDLVRTLNDNVGPVVVQAMTGTKDRAQPHRWADPQGPEPRAATQQQLRLGYRVWRMIESSDGPSVALAWLVGANPRLGESTPVSAIRDGKAKEVIAAAAAFCSDAGPG